MENMDLENFASFYRHLCFISPFASGGGGGGQGVFLLQLQFSPIVFNQITIPVVGNIATNQPRYPPLAFYCLLNSYFLP